MAQATWMCLMLSQLFKAILICVAGEHKIFDGMFCATADLDHFRGIIISRQNKAITVAIEIIPLVAL
jgi:hypothetical protein